jgi:cytochrome c oxidase subunit 4
MNAATPDGTAEGVSTRRLFLTWLALMLLAGLSLSLRFARLGTFGMPVAIAIAAAKALLVVLVFMEFAHEKATVRWAFLAGLVMVALLMSLMIADVMTRAVPPLQDPPGTQPRDYG